MRQRRFIEEQIIVILKQNEARAAVNPLCREHGIGEGTSYKWKSKYGGLEISEAKRLWTLEGENSNLKSLNQAHTSIEKWREGYNQFRPHSSLSSRRSGRNSKNQSRISTQKWDEIR